jgi:hypothetical protein
VNLKLPHLSLLLVSLLEVRPVAIASRIEIWKQD